MKVRVNQFRSQNKPTVIAAIFLFFSLFVPTYEMSYATGLQIEIESEKSKMKLK